MQRALSALMPLRNVQGSLESIILEWLEVLTELTPKTEIVVVDDASSDATIEVALELMTQYPQLRVLRHRTPRGWHASLLTAMERSHGEVLVFPDPDCALGLNELPRLWLLLDQYEVVLAGPNSDAIQEWGESAGGGYQLGFRRAFESVRDMLAGRSALVAALRAGGYRFIETQVALRYPPMARYRAACQARKLFVSRAPERTGDSAAPPAELAMPARPNRPNYLSRLREFARGQQPGRCFNQSAGGTCADRPLGY